MSRIKWLAYHMHEDSEARAILLIENPPAGCEVWYLG